MRINYTVNEFFFRENCLINFMRSVIEFILIMSISECSSENFHKIFSLLILNDFNC